jgi:uncharacterized protein
MQLQQSFTVRATPDATYAFLLDVKRVAACIPGVQEVEEREPDTYVGAFKVKVGPISMTYRGTGTLLTQDPETRQATGSAEGTEGLGASRVKATGLMVVTPTDDGSLVTLSGDLQIAGRVAQFGRGIIDSMAKRIVGQMAACIGKELEDQAPESSAG